MRPPPRPRPQPPKDSPRPQAKPAQARPAGSSPAQKRTPTRTVRGKAQQGDNLAAPQAEESDPTLRANEVVRKEPSTGKGTGTDVGGRGESRAASTIDPSHRTAPASSSVSTGFAARLDERTKAERRRRWNRISILGLVVLLVFAIAWLLFFSSVFRLSAEQVRITGQGAVIAPGAVEKVVTSEVGTPLTLLDTVGLRNRILRVAGVRDVALTRQWPDGLSVELTAREPVAAVPDGTGFTLRDDVGDVVGRAKKVPKGLPVIKIPDGSDTARTLEAAIFMLNAIPADLHQEIKSISAKTPDAVKMKLRDGATVLWGNQTDADLKVRVFEVLRSAKETKGARVFDVSAPNAPITR